MSFDIVSVCNAALEQIASQEYITDINDGSNAANAAKVVYNPTVNLMLRELDPDFARRTVALSPATGTPITPWQYEYVYPPDCVRARQVRPATFDANNPTAVLWQVGIDVISSVPTKVILCNIPSAVLNYTGKAATESQWDAIFYDAVVRRLANPLAMALSGRPDFARELLEQSAMVAATGEAGDDSMIRLT